jgi:hypothetical protein
MLLLIKGVILSYTIQRTPGRVSTCMGVGEGEGFRTENQGKERSLKFIQNFFC